MRWFGRGWALLAVVGALGCNATRTADPSTTATQEITAPTSVVKASPAPRSGLVPIDASQPVAATVRGDRIVVRSAGRSDAAVVANLDNPLPSGAPLTFLVLRNEGAWTEVSLPIRPNGSTGWVPTESLRLTNVPYRVEVALGLRELTVFAGDQLVVRETVAIGKEPTPTPGGHFYLLELLETDDPTGPYGPYAFGLSGFSEQLTSFNGGEGRLGLHGTNEPEQLGGIASKGCIRVANDVIVLLADLLPLGTPIAIFP